MMSRLNFVVIAGVMYCLGCTTATESTSEQVKSIYTNYLRVFINSVDSLQQKISGNDTAVFNACFLAARKSYKAVEPFAEYYNPSTAKAINGPALPEVEPDNPDYPSPPTGFQVIEELLFPVYDKANYPLLLKEIAALKAASTRLEMVNENLVFTDAHIFDAIRLGCFRIETLGITGFDTPVSFSALTEIPPTLEAIKNYLGVYRSKTSEAAFARLSDLLMFAIEYTNEHPGFDQFNRAVFLRAYINPLTRQLNELQQAASIPFFKEPRPLAANAPTLFEPGIFNAVFYTGSHTDSGSESLVTLGKLLFNEQRLSVANTRSCSSCHDESKAFSDGLAKNKTFDGKRTILRNTPTILYAGLQPALFADSRVAFLEDQAKQVVENPDEMHGNLVNAAIELSKDAGYKNAFHNALGDTIITPAGIQKALAVYIRSKSSFSSRFDEYMRGDLSKLDSNETAGFNLFMGKAKCGTCHFMPLFNGNVPPLFNKIESEVLGVPRENNKPYVIDADSGKYRMIRSAPYLYAFKTVTVRNSALTAPYMHNGVFRSLEEVIEFYNDGGGAGRGIKLDNQTLPADRLNLTAKEKQQLVAFIRTLNDEQ
ncbi:cytochrome-c peroxidase [Panacibacter sp. DH6]|uniref:Cytochrome-c peroxidase n=1 Tax=Panacibacter microcysteis TaxID=2793269 RepID=A0A931GYD7_9BACT|nr:cytochrome c peroxidase [Panacibacter microcysteis]MBG9375462.1 cytochrome-c peroxidase [Panacibacter microcysteis]